MFLQQALTILVKVRYVQRYRRSDRKAQRVTFHRTIHERAPIRLKAVEWSDNWRIICDTIMQNAPSILIS